MILIIINDKYLYDRYWSTSFHMHPDCWDILSLAISLLTSRGEHQTGIGGSGPENKKPDRVSGEFWGLDIRHFGGRGFPVSGFSGRVFGSPRFSDFFSLFWTSKSKTKNTKVPIHQKIKTKYKIPSLTSNTKLPNCKYQVQTLLFVISYQLSSKSKSTVSFEATELMVVVPSWVDVGPIFKFANSTNLQLKSISTSCQE